jgi:hypothetical protein
MAMEQEKGAYILRGISLIQLADQFSAQLDQSVVFGRRFW